MKKILIAGITGIGTCTLGVAGYFLFIGSSKKLNDKNKNKQPTFRVNPQGKSLMSKYPDAKIPEQANTLNSDNSFWLGKTQKLKTYLTSKDTPKTIDIEHPLVQKIIDSRLSGSRVHAGLEKKHFSLDNYGKFLLGDPEISTVLATFCKTKKDETYSDIADFPDVMKDLCIEETDIK